MASITSFHYSVEEMSSTDQGHDTDNYECLVESEVTVIDLQLTHDVFHQFHFFEGSI